MRMRITVPIALALLVVGWLVYSGSWDCRVVGEIHGEWCKAVTIDGRSIAAFVRADHHAIEVYASR